MYTSVGSILQSHLQPDAVEMFLSVCVLTPRYAPLIVSLYNIVQPLVRPPNSPIGALLDKTLHVVDDEGRYVLISFEITRHVMLGRIQK